MAALYDVPEDTEQSEFYLVVFSMSYIFPNLKEFLIRNPFTEVFKDVSPV